MWITSKKNTEIEMSKPYLEVDYETTGRANSFMVVTKCVVLKFMNKLATKSCELDPMPTSLVKENCDILIDHITDIVNKSIATGVFPSNFKSAILRPLLKKANLPLIHKSYRPVSNLTYLGNIIETVVSNQLEVFTAQSGNTGTRQSAYKKFHSTESALLEVNTDIMDCFDQKRVVYLVSLDLSPAFDTVSCEILLNGLKYRYGLGGAIVSWIKSYMSNRTQSVVIDGAKSQPVELKWGVP